MEVLPANARELVQTARQYRHVSGKVRRSLRGHLYDEFVRLPVDVRFEFVHNATPLGECLMSDVVRLALLFDRDALVRHEAAFVLGSEARSSSARYALRRALLRDPSWL